MGHSAGGQLALMAAKRTKVPLRGVLSLAGVVDMRAFVKATGGGCGEGALKAMGGTPEQYPELYAEVSPLELLPVAVPQVLVWGDDDGIVPRSMFWEYERHPTRR